MKNNHFLLFVLLGLLSSFQSRAQDQEIKVGGNAPEIRLPTPKGDTVSLSSVKGDLILVDFWASWCAPCVLEQPELKRLYGVHNIPNALGRKLEIFAVSLDSKKQSWQNAIKKYQIPWYQVSDLKFWISPVARDYHIDSLPFNVLLDSKRVIVALNLHGKELEEFVEAYLQRK